MGEDVKSIIKHSPRYAGTENEWQAAEYVENEFRMAELKVEVDEVLGVNAWEHLNTRVRIVEPAER